MGFKCIFNDIGFLIVLSCFFFKCDVGLPVQTLSVVMKFKIASTCGRYLTYY